MTAAMTAAVPRPGPTESALPSRRRVLKSFGALLAAAAATPVFLPAGPLLAAGRPRVLAATYPAWLALEAATEGLSDFECDLLVDSLAGCPHDYAMTPQERMKLSSCDILILNGLGFEAFLDETLLSSLFCQVVDLADEIARMPMLPGEGAQGPSMPLAPVHGNEGENEEPRGHDHAHGGVNPHYFANPSRFALMVEVASRVLGKAVPAAAPKLEERAQKIEEEAGKHLAAMRKLEAALKDAKPGQKVRLVLQHDTLAWFFADTDFVLEAVLQEGDDEAPSAARLLELSTRMKEEPGLWLLVGESQYPKSLLDVLGQETGVRPIVLDPMAAGPRETSPNFYFETMAQNRRVLEEALLGEPLAGK